MIKKLLQYIVCEEKNMDKVVVVTGGGSGIGKAVVKCLPKEYIIVVADVNEKNLNDACVEFTNLGYRIIPFVFDVSKRDEVKALANKACQFGKIERMINCAGISGTMSSVDKVFKINALGTVYMNQEFYEVMDNAVICNIASNSSYILPKILLPSKRTFKLALSNEQKFLRRCVCKSKIFHQKYLNGDMAYLISKTFIRWYVSNCAYKYISTKNIRIFSVSPGYVNTPMTEKEKGKLTENMLSYCGLNKGADPKEIAQIIVSLSNPSCSYLIGSDVICDGGCINNKFGITTFYKKYNGKSKNEKW